MRVHHLCEVQHVEWVLCCKGLQQVHVPAPASALHTQRMPACTGSAPHTMYMFMSSATTRMKVHMGDQKGECNAGVCGETDAGLQNLK